ncbi:VOC family protein [Nostoc sp. UIC 10890]
MSSQTDVQVQRIRAIGLTVTNCDRSLNFYTQALTFELVPDIMLDYLIPGKGRPILSDWRRTLYF